MSAATTARAPAEPRPLSPWRRFAAAVEAFNVFAGYASGVAIIVTSLIIVFEVLVRYFLQWPTDWEIEASIILLIVATFMSAGFTQLKRGHVTIEVLEHVLSPKVNYWRMLAGDLLSLVFCGFVALNSWELFHEAWAEGRVSNSVWGPPMWIPFLSMAVGMTTLSLQIVIQIVDALNTRVEPPPPADAAVWKE